MTSENVETSYIFDFFNNFLNVLRNVFSQFFIAKELIKTF